MIIDRIIIYNNTLTNWLLAIGYTLILFFVTYSLKKTIYKKLSGISPETETEWDDVGVEILGCIHNGVLLIFSIYIGAMELSLPQSVFFVIEKIFIIALLIQLVNTIAHLIDFWFERFKKRKMETDAAAVTTLSSVSFIIKAVLWIILVLVVLDNFGVNVTSLITGLGISGIAVALAVQNILGDLLSSFSIVFDQPFVIGDFIIVDDYMGAVEHIGLKTTRIRSLSGEQLIFSNSDLLKSRIKNFKRMYERRVIFQVSVVYQTDYDHLKLIPSVIKKIIENQPYVRFERSHFKELGAFALNFETVYWISNPDYMVYMNIHESINLGIYKHFKELGIEFAFPTQTLYLRNLLSETEPKSTLISDDPFQNDNGNS